MQMMQLREARVYSVHHDRLRLFVYMSVIMPPPLIGGTLSDVFV